MIDFNRPAIVGKELTYIKDAVDPVSYTHLTLPTNSRV